MKELPHTRSCFVCGEANPAGLKLRFQTDGRIVQARFVTRADHVGFKHTLHGGVIAALLDEIMVWACAVRTKRFGFCVELNVRFVRIVRPDEPVIATGELAENRRDKLFTARADLKDDGGKVLATATGKYLPLRPAELAEMAGELIGDGSWLEEGTAPYH
jgi:uncharacterized protein (TIGR00369 family)